MNSFIALREKVEQEYKEYKSRLTSLSADQILEYEAYQYVYKTEIKDMLLNLDCEEKEAQALLSVPGILDHVYDRWLHFDSYDLAVIPDIIKEVANEYLDNWQHKEGMDIFNAHLDSKHNIIIYGDVADNRFLDSIIQVIPLDERLIIITDDTRYNLNRENSVHLSLSEKSHSLDIWIKTALRMSPDRLIINTKIERDLSLIMKDSRLAGVPIIYCTDDLAKQGIIEQALEESAITAVLVHVDGKNNGTNIQTIFEYDPKAKEERITFPSKPPEIQPKDIPAAPDQIKAEEPGKDM